MRQEMKWENLATGNCPYCNGGLFEESGEHKCENCYFRINSKRMEMVKKHRSGPHSSLPKMKWQMLKENKCPVCAHELHFEGGLIPVLKCTSPHCVFKIREAKADAILNDQSHPANRFSIEENKNLL